MLPREKDHKYEVEHRNGLLYIRTNRNARNFRIATVPTADPRSEKWQEFVAHKPDVLLESVELFKDFAIVHELHQGLI